MRRQQQITHGKLITPRILCGGIIKGSDPARTRLQDFAVAITRKLLLFASFASPGGE